MVGVCYATHRFDRGGCGGSGEEDEHLTERAPRGSDGWRTLRRGTSDPWGPPAISARRVLASEPGPEEKVSGGVKLGWYGIREMGRGWKIWPSC